MNSAIQNFNNAILSSREIEYLNTLIDNCLEGKRIINIHINSLNTCKCFRNYIIDFICDNYMLDTKQLNRLDTLIYLLQEKELTIQLSNKELTTLDVKLNTEGVI